METDLLKNYTAFEALSESQKVDEDQLLEVLKDIQKEAQKRNRCLWVYKPLDKSTIDELENRYFKVIAQPGIATQRDGVYYQIKW